MLLFFFVLFCLVFVSMFMIVAHRKIGCIGVVRRSSIPVVTILVFILFYFFYMFCLFCFFFVFSDFAIGLSKILYTVCVLHIAKAKSFLFVSRIHSRYDFNMMHIDDGRVLLNFNLQFNFFSSHDHTLKCLNFNWNHQKLLSIGSIIFHRIYILLWWFLKRVIKR